jgi:hypothetical protein
MVKTQRILKQAMKSYRDGAVMKGMDKKSDEEIIASFSQNKMTVFT